MEDWENEKEEEEEEEEGGCLLLGKEGREEDEKEEEEDEVGKEDNFSDFALTYGDGLSDVDLAQELEFHFLLK